MGSARKKATGGRRKRSRRKRSRPALRALLAAAALFVAGAIAAAGMWFFQWRAPVAPVSGPWRTLQWPPSIPPGSDAEQKILAGLGLQSETTEWQLYRSLIATRPIEPGSHWIPTALTGPKVLDFLTRSRRRPVHRVLLPEGVDRFDVAARLEAANICERAAFLAAMRDQELLAVLEIAGDSAEGYLFPDSYDLYENSAPGAVVRTLVTHARKRIAHAAELEQVAKAQRSASWERDIVTLASLVEREARAPSELRVIAGVFRNRLMDASFKPRRMLQTDPSAAYGCKLYGGTVPSCSDFDGKVTPAMLRDASNPYNTYKHPGLPPGPIANPGEGALRAAMNPAQTEYLFFVARGDGTHTFSRTLAEHESATNGGN